MCHCSIPYVGSLPVPNGVSMVEKTDDLQQQYLEVTLIRDPRLTLNILPHLKQEFLSVLHENASLILGDVVVNLFETETLMDKIPEYMFYDPRRDRHVIELMNMSGEAITQLFVDYISEGVRPAWLDPSGGIASLSLPSDPMGDLDILDVLSWKDFEITEETAARITIDRISFLGVGARATIYLHDRGIDYSKIIDAVRKKFHIPFLPERGYAAALEVAVDDYMRISSENRVSVDDCLFMAQNATSVAAFRRMYKKRLVELGVPLTKTQHHGGHIGECYVSDVSGGFANGSFAISRRGIHYAYKQEARCQHAFADKGTPYKGSELWEVCYRVLRNKKGK